MEVWDRARTICISLMQGANQKSRAERNFSMVQSVVRDGVTFKIIALNKLTASKLESEYGEALTKSFQLAGAGDDVKVEFTFDGTHQPTIVVPKTTSAAPRPDAAPVEAKPEEVFISTMPLKEYYTFDEFVEGPSNSYVVASAKGVAKNPGQKGMNPLFIHGGTGLGKTHLMQAIGNEIKRNNPRASVCYLTAEVLMNEYVNALTNSCLPTFKDRYRKVDILLVDDIQFIAKHMQQFQEEFFNTFNALTSADKQIVLTSDVAPKDIPGIEERLISRFEGGLLQEIESPAYETRLAILHKKAESMVTPVSNNTLVFIAKNIRSHVRAMEGALSKVSIFCNRDPSMPLNDETLSYILRDFIAKEKSRKKITVEDLQNSICKKYSITLDQLLSPERTQSIVTPRQLAMYMARKFTTQSLPEIALKFNKSHATIIHGAKNISKRLDVEQDLRSVMEEILEDLGCSMEDVVNN